jgi:hypothetical protein
MRFFARAARKHWGRGASVLTWPLPIGDRGSGPILLTVCFAACWSPKKTFMKIRVRARRDHGTRVQKMLPPRPGLRPEWVFKVPQME